MKNRKNLYTVLLIMVMAFVITACGTSAGDDSKTKDQKTEQLTESSKTAENSEKEEVDSQVIEPDTENTSEESSDTAKASENQSDILVVYFSATGTTKGVAERIAEAEDADIYEIVPKEPYSDADLDWNDESSRTTKEQNDPSVRPEIGSESIDLSGYSKIYVGYPIWWGEEPRIMDTFVESYDFGQTTMIPFCTSGGSGIGRSGSNLADRAGSGSWQSGDRLSGNIDDADLQEWIDNYK